MDINPHRCKLCCRNFPNGRALGGHMRSHVVNFTIPDRSYDELSSSSFTSDDEDEDEDDEDEDGLELGCYKLRENPKKSMKLSDVQFSSVSVTLLEREVSESESFKINPTRKRSKRKFGLLFKNKMKVTNTSIETTSSMSPASSVSEVITSEEDVALCLMKLSRDNWPHVPSEDDGKTKGKYTCLTCDKVFKSYQALGGHRASHKKLRQVAILESESKPEPSKINTKSKIHECPVCLRVFASAQALGGHKRTHSGAGALKSNAKRENGGLIDLNLPAPEEEEDDDMISLSAVSDPRF